MKYAFGDCFAVTDSLIAASAVVLDSQIDTAGWICSQRVVIQDVMHSTIFAAMTSCMDGYERLLWYTLQVADHLQLLIDRLLLLGGKDCSHVLIRNDFVMHSGYGAHALRPLHLSVDVQVSVRCPVGAYYLSDSHPYRLRSPSMTHRSSVLTSSQPANVSCNRCTILRATSFSSRLAP